MLHTFTPSIEIVGQLASRVRSDAIHEEPMLHSASIDFAYSYGGHLTRAVIDHLDTTKKLLSLSEYCLGAQRYPVIDTRSHMLMPGQYPAIPGYHCDAYPRSDYRAQPDVSAGDPAAFHFVYIVSDAPGVSRTSYVDAPMCIDVDPDAVWRSVDLAVTGRASLRAHEEGQIIRFGQETIHSAMPCAKRGWRFFFRLSPMFTPPQNRIRRQVQVYTTASGGW